METGVNHSSNYRRTGASRFSLGISQRDIVTAAGAWPSWLMVLGFERLTGGAALKVNMLEAKSQLSKLVKAAVEGQDIASNGVPMVNLVKVEPRKHVRKPGAYEA